MDWPDFARIETCSFGINGNWVDYAKGLDTK